MKTNPAGDLYKRMEKSLNSDMSDEKPSGFFARGGLQKDSSLEPAEIARRYFMRFRKAREDFNNG